jgi:hypothetical protein
MQNIVFFLVAFNDIDHIAPVIWQCLDRGQRATLVFLQDYDFGRDYRIQFLQQEFPDRVEIVDFPKAYGTNFRKKLTRLGKYRKQFALKFLRSRRPDACVFEWGEGLRQPQNLIDRVSQGLGHYRSLRTNFLAAAQELGVRTYCLPHGLAVQMNQNMNRYVTGIFARTGKYPDFSDRNAFDYYVYQSHYHREQQLAWGMDPARTFVWGSARFYPPWAARNLNLCGRFTENQSSEGKLKLVFMIPQWIYNVHRGLTLELIEALVKLPGVYLIIKDSTRAGEGGLTQGERAQLDALSHVEASTVAHSPALVKWADLVLSFGSSIGFEVLLQNKPLLNPHYLHTNTTIFDQTQACIPLANAPAVLGAINSFQQGRKLKIDESARQAIFREVIYGGRNTDFDVLDYYYRQICQGESAEGN